MGVSKGKESIAMSTFPARILLATDGSEEADLAALTAVELADATHSELHVVHVGMVPIFLKSYPGTLGYERRIYEQIEEMSRELLRKQTWRVKAVGAPWPELTSGWGRWLWRSWPWPRSSGLT
jgi:nucleotide-binding universal stress UspA family protein